LGSNSYPFFSDFCPIFHLGLVKIKSSACSLLLSSACSLLLSSACSLLLSSTSATATLGPPLCALLSSCAYIY